VTSRSITISVRFYCGKWKQKFRLGSLESKNPLQFDFRDSGRSTTVSYSLSTDCLDDKEFIQELKSWLKETKTTLELNFEKWGE
jgi:hypothetical protein